MSAFDSSEIAIIGISYLPKWYKGVLKSIKHSDKVRGDLILYSIRYARGVGYQVVVVDGGSSKTFVNELKKIKGINLMTVKTIKRSPNRRKAIFAASKIPGVKTIVMTEIEKVSMVTDCIPMAVKPILDGNADIVVPKRENGMFRKTYPNYMYESEVEANLLYNEELRSNGLLSPHDDDLDTFFGVRVFKNDKRMLKQLFSHYQGNPFNSLIAHKLFDLEEYSNSQFFPVVKALFLGKNVVSVTVPFKYPETQKKNEEDGEKEYFLLKRRYQRLTILVELMHFLGYLEHKKTRKINKV